MICLCTSKFNKEEQDSPLLQGFFTRREMRETKEERGVTSDMLDFHPIIDTEDSRGHEGQDIEHSDSIDDVIDHTAEPTLPNSKSSTQLRATLQACKRVRRDEDVYDYH
ncbi:unnamed protein product [Penicillium salamii]|nr:unnamed protein product [Penicillium salamii]